MTFVTINRAGRGWEMISLPERSLGGYVLRLTTERIGGRRRVSWWHSDNPDNAITVVEGEAGVVQVDVARRSG